MDLLLGIGTYLQTNGLVQGLGTDCFVDYQPDTPDNIVVVYEYSSPPPISAVRTLDRRIQIAVRNVSSDASRQLSNDIWNLLAGDLTADKTVLSPDGTWAAFFPLQAPIKLKVDDKNRTIYTCNYSVTALPD